RGVYWVTRLRGDDGWLCCSALAYTLNIFTYFALISSDDFSTPAASSFMVLTSLNGLRPAFSLTDGCTERWPPTSEISCWHSPEKQKLWNSRAALGFGASLNTPFGPTTNGVPSVA